MDRPQFCRRLAAVLEKSPSDFEASGGALPEEMDSLQLLDIMALVDEMFGVALSPEALKGAKSASDVLDLVAANLPS